MTRSIRALHQARGFDRLGRSCLCPSHAIKHLA